MSGEAETGAQSSDRLRQSPIGDDFSLTLARANAISLERTHRVLAAHGLKVRSYAVLGLAVAGARPTQRELSEFLRLDPSQIVALIDGLERKGLLQREPDARDRRVKVVTATSEGARVFAEARADTRRSEEEWLRTIPPERRAMLAELLGELAHDEKPR